MTRLDPIRPYLALIKVAAALTIALVMFVTGCNHGKREQAADDRALLDEKDHALLEAHTALGTAAAKFREISANTQVQAVAAKARAQLADAAVQAAKVRADTLQSQLKAAQHELDEAMTDPDCRKLLETPSCAAFR
ncbi:hypothetical protein LVB77_14645 [Lysobacter sp. 5GHs7-4]|uniref:hypothetical protein n=1 Tax=Lysobacter sp. 5GHs7-4 TaxID=2904253 RepID=UPI001E4A42FA|nr:hypothetical protein [Lysobacter sp. 5GHs7-4]UHQ21905.1 hypothetical protein LVB77_14645 [Lysobacter sp. 5GHs7-4]